MKIEGAIGAILGMIGIISTYGCSIGKIPILGPMLQSIPGIGSLFKTNQKGLVSEFLKFVHGNKDTFKSFAKAMGYNDDHPVVALIDQASDKLYNDYSGNATDHFFN